MNQKTNNREDYRNFPGSGLFFRIVEFASSLPPSPIQKKSQKLISWLDRIYENLKTDRADIEKSKYILPPLLESFLTILDQYNSFEEKIENSNDRRKIEIQVLESLETLHLALRNHLNNLLENNQIALETEIQLLKNLILSEGLLNTGLESRKSQLDTIDLIHSSGRELQVKSGEILGRTDGPHASFFSEMKYISGRHASLSCRNRIWFLRDLSSTNRTKLNGEYIVEEIDMIVQDGDSIILADEEFLIREKH